MGHQFIGDTIQPSSVKTTHYTQIKGTDPHGPQDASDRPSWYWALRTDNRVASLDGAKAEFEASWKQRKAWAKMEEVE